ncbi:MAG: hypothetical protein H7175_01290 [Burkholderiales bacterium]|nr:hypothetical protein [Anaerolineae bacterium]
MTRKLWIALCNAPNNHPLFRRMHDRDQFNDDRPQRHLAGWVSWVGVLALYICAILWPALMNTPILIATLLLSGTVLGLIWALDVSATIASEQEFGTYDVLAISPPGPLGICWTMSMACIHRNGAFRRLNEQHIWSIRLFLAVPLMIWFGIQLSPDYVRVAPFAPIAYAFAAVAALCLDHIQSAVLGVLVGVLSPTHTSRRFEAQLFALPVFLIIQIAAYLAAIIGTSVALLVLREMNGIIEPLVDVGAAFFGVAIIYVVREVAIILLWRKLGERLNATTTERDHMLRLAL